METRLRKKPALIGAALLSVGLGSTVATASANTAATLFHAAEKKLDAGDYQGALRQFTGIETSFPERDWPRRYRHELAYTHYRLGHWNEARKTWATLLCESASDELAFPIAYNLALVEDRLGETDIAYWVLSLVPPKQVASRPPSQLRLYLEAAGDLAQKQRHFLAAAEVYAVAAATLHDSAARQRFREKFKGAAEHLEEEDLATLKGQVTDAYLRRYLQTLTGKSHRKSEIPAPPVAPDIPGLKILPLAVKEKTLVTATSSTSYLQVAGRYDAPDRRLYCAGLPIERASDGRFTLTLEIQGSSARAALFSVAPGQPAEQKTEEYFQTDWRHFQAPELPEDLKPAGETGSESPGNSATVRWDWAQFEVNVLAQIQSGSNHAYVTEGAWSPAYRLLTNFDLHGVFGFFVSEKSGGGDFAVADYRLFLSYLAWGQLSMELGGGGETWISFGGTHGLAAARLGWQFGVPLLGNWKLDRIELVGTRQFDPYATKELGVAFRFGF